MHRAACRPWQPCPCGQRRGRDQLPAAFGACVSEKTRGGSRDLLHRWLGAGTGESAISTCHMDTYARRDSACVVGGGAGNGLDSWLRGRENVDSGVIFGPKWPENHPKSGENRPPWAKLSPNTAPMRSTDWAGAGSKASAQPAGRPLRDTHHYGPLYWGDGSERDNR